MDVPQLSESELITQLRAFDALQPRTEKALKLARQVHSEQSRKGGGSYLEEHIYPVTSSVAHFLASRQSSELVPAVLTALLHDAVEDSDWVDLDSVERRFGPTVAEWVGLLTKQVKGFQDDAAKREAEGRYVDGIRAAPFPVRLIKVQDRLNNLAGLHKQLEPERVKYLKETRCYYVELAEDVDPGLASQMKERVQQQESGECPQVEPLPPRPVQTGHTNKPDSPASEFRD